MSRITVHRKVIQVNLGAPPVAREDVLAVEEPLEIRVGGRSLVVTMRTPGQDVDLAAGFLVSGGVITSGEQFSAARYCAGVNEQGQNTYNVLDVTLGPGVPPPDPSLDGPSTPPARAVWVPRRASRACVPSRPTT